MAKVDVAVVELRFIAAVRVVKYISKLMALVSAAAMSLYDINIILMVIHGQLTLRFTYWTLLLVYHKGTIIQNGICLALEMWQREALISLDGILYQFNLYLYCTLLVSCYNFITSCPSISLLVLTSWAYYTCYSCFCWHIFYLFLWLSLPFSSWR